LATPLFRSLR